MKKLGVIFKEASENRIKKSIEGSGSFFITKYSGLSGPDMNALRKSLRAANSELFVVKNTTARRVLKGVEDNSALLDIVSGPSGFVFAKEDPVNTAKTLHTFAKTHEKFVLAGGFLDKKVLNKQDIERLAKLPSREVLLTQVVVGLKSPITGFVMVLKGNLRKFVYCLKQIEQKKTT